jgi:quinohemoprotein ethanol dehydrogenase
MIRVRYTGYAAFAVCLLTSTWAAFAADVTGERIIGADNEPGNWLSHGRTFSEQRFSPLTKIDTANVSRLGLAWSYDIKNRSARGIEATPIVIDGLLYTTGALKHLYPLR